jgi:signal transduction histidine kinase
MSDAETGVRGYIITKDPRFLEPYNSGSQKLFPLYKELKTLIADNEEAKTSVEALGTLVRRKIAFMSDGLAKFQHNGFVMTDDMKIAREPSKSAMDSIRLLVKQLQEREYALMKERSDELNGFFTSTKIITITSLLIALITVIYSVVIYNRENKAKEKATASAMDYAIALEERVGELNRVNTELQELKSIEKFASTGRIARTIAHEVRNPLTNISLASEQLKEMTGQNEEALMFHEMISRNSNRINQLVSELLNSTRFAQLEYSQSNINQVLDEALELAKDRIDLNNIKVEKYYEKDLCDIYVDKEKIRLAFLNLIVNAIEAMEKGSGVLQLRTRKYDDKCIIEITDNGKGMDTETLGKLFEPYFTSKSKGNGLGLTNTQNIILNHRGAINVRSSVGKGTSFIVTLNLTPDGADEKV